MPAHVLAQDLESARHVEQPGGVQPAGAIEDALSLPQGVGQGRKHLARDDGPVGQGVAASRTASMLALPQMPHDEVA